MFGRSIAAVFAVMCVALLVVGCSLYGGITPAPEGTVQMSGAAFVPQSLTRAAGQTVHWINNDNAAHTVTSDTGVFNSDTGSPSGLGHGDTFDFQIPADAASGTTYYYHCRIHGVAGNGSAYGTGMAGRIVVQ